MLKVQRYLQVRPGGVLQGLDVQIEDMVDLHLSRSDDRSQHGGLGAGCDVHRHLVPSLLLLDQDLAGLPADLLYVVPGDVQKHDLHEEAVEEEDTAEQDDLKQSDDSPNRALCIEDLNLPPQILKPLVAGGVTTLRALTDMTSGQVLSIPGIGPARLAEIQAALRKLGLNLADG